MANKGPLRKTARKVLDGFSKRALGHPTMAESRIAFEIQVQSAARGLAASGDHRIVHPPDATRAGTSMEQIRIAFVGNMANNAYNFVRCLRRAGYQADLILQDGWLDTFLMNRPFWEDVPAEVRSYEEGLVHEAKWNAPPFVRLIAFDVERQQRYGDRFSAVPEVQAEWKRTFGSDLASDRALVLAQQMGHWPLLETLRDYDVVFLSGAAITLGAFSPRPFVVFPTGGDLHITPFEENLSGFLTRAAYRSAGHVLICETDYPRYVERLDTAVMRSFSPLMLDTETYAPGAAPDLRDAWTRKSGGTRFIVGVCRQSWEWKGSDRLVRGFASFAGKYPEWRLVLLEWGTDVDKTKALATELGIDSKVLWEPLCSKPTLRLRQRAADVVADQFVMEGYGTSVLEALAAGKTVVMIAPPSEATRHVPEPPPFVGARSADEIAEAFARLSDDRLRAEAASKSLRWVRAHHSPEATIPKYLDAIRSALGLPLPVGHLGSTWPLREGLALLHSRLRHDVRGRFKRSVSLGDELTDRWDRARFLGFGEGASIYDSALVIGDVKVGAKTWIGPDCVLDGSGGLEIGATCSIATGAHVYSHDTVDWAVSGGVAAYERAPTRVGDAVYIGPHSVVTAGSRIGSHCIVGALSLVKGEFPDYTFLAGIPAKALGRVVVEGDQVRIVQDEQKR